MGIADRGSRLGGAAEVSGGILLQILGQRFQRVGEVHSREEVVKKLRVVLVDAAVLLQSVEELEPLAEVVPAPLRDGTQRHQHVQVVPLELLAHPHEHLLERQLLFGRGDKPGGAVGENERGFPGRSRGVQVAIVPPELLHHRGQVAKLLHVR